jgi:DNA-binding CsgD family transcriptional regulator
MAKELGDTNRAKACYEQALLVVRQYQISLWIPLLCLSYADLLACMGQSHTAHEYLLEALSSTARAPSLDMNFAGVGIPIALQMGDEAALVKCARSTVIELAFESGRPGAIGNMACAFAQLYASQGRGNAARALLHRALEKIHNVHDNLDLTIEIARQGALSDVSSARALLEKRVHLPHADVFQAGLALFDACVEQRGDNHRKAHTHARNAAERFTALQWYGRAELAHSMIPNKGYTEPPAVLHGKPFSHMQQALTPREQEVAALALKGFTNRTIATELSIAPHTVEKHMNSIMNRLGIRSRHQLTDVLDNPPEA